MGRSVVVWAGRLMPVDQIMWSHRQPYGTHIDISVALKPQYSRAFFALLCTGSY